MGLFQNRTSSLARLSDVGERPVLVVGFTHSQTAIVLHGRLRAFREAGFRVVVISSPGPLLDRLAQEECVEFIPVPMERGIAPIRDIVSLVRLCVELRRLKPVISEFSTPKAGLLGNLAAFVCRVPKRVYLLRGLRLETAHGAKRFALWASELVAGSCSHVVLCNSPSLLESARKLRLAPERKLRLVGQGSSRGVNTDHFRPGPASVRPELILRSASPLIGYFGRLTRDKGIPQLLEAFDQLLRIRPAARLLLVGWYDSSDDALSEEQRRHIDAHPSITRTGFVSDPAPYYRGLDMLVLPTFREGFPNVALEAAATGVPVITTSATGARDAVRAGVTGLTVAPGDVAGLLAAMETLAGDPKRARQMGADGRNWVLKYFTQDRVQSLSLTFYRNLLRSRQTVGVRAATTREAAQGD